MYGHIELYMASEIILDKMEDAYCEISTAWICLFNIYYRSRSKLIEEERKICISHHI